jgi:hypothetical protein
MRTTQSVTVDDILDDDIRELYVSEVNRFGNRTGLHFAITQNEYNGYWE